MERDTRRSRAVAGWVRDGTPDSAFVSRATHGSGRRSLVRGCIIALALAATVGAALAKNYRLSFSGYPILEGQGGLTVVHDEPREHLFVSSRPHNYWLALPYSETWEFVTGKKLPLEARDGVYDVAIEILEARRETEAEFLRNGLQDPGIGDVIKSELLEAHGRPVLRYLTEGGALSKRFAGEQKTFWNYCCVTRRQNSWYSLRISRAYEGGPPASAVEEQLLDILGAGFGADFNGR